MKNRKASSQRFKIKMDLSRLLFWLILTSTSFILILLIITVLMPVGEPAQTTLPEIRNGQVITVKYKSDLSDLMEKYIGQLGELSDLTIDSPYLAITKQTKNQVLELIVPGEFRDLHLDIVVALNYLESGFGGDGEKFDLGKKNLEELLEQNTWLLE